MTLNGSENLKEIVEKINLVYPNRFLLDDEDLGANPIPVTLKQGYQGNIGKLLTALINEGLLKLVVRDQREPHHDSSYHDDRLYLAKRGANELITASSSDEILLQIYTEGGYRYSGTFQATIVPLKGGFFVNGVGIRFIPPKDATFSLSPVPEEESVTTASGDRMGFPPTWIRQEMIVRRPYQPSFLPETTFNVQATIGSIPVPVKIKPNGVPWSSPDQRSHASAKFAPHIDAHTLLVNLDMPLSEPPTLEGPLFKQFTFERLTFEKLLAVDGSRIDCFIDPKKDDNGYQVLRFDPAETVNCVELRWLLSIRKVNENLSFTNLPWMQRLENQHASGLTGPCWQTQNYEFEVARLQDLTSILSQTPKFLLMPKLVPSHNGAF